MAGETHPITSKPNHHPRHLQGRPSLFRDAYIEEVKSFMGQGHSLTAFAGEIGVARDTVYQWAREIPAFSDALNKARAKRVLAWENRLARQADGAQGSVAATIFALKNAAPDEWRDKIEVSQTVSHEHLHRFELTALDPEALDAIAEALTLAADARANTIEGVVSSQVLDKPGK